MGQPAAKQGDRVTATDSHLVQPPPPSTSPPVPTPMPFSGVIDGALSPNVNILNMPAATVGSTSTNTPPHVALNGTFVRPPTNKGTIIKGSVTVTINGKPAARNGDSSLTCNDPIDLPAGTVVATGTVNIGG
jgi:uncharacterized Zn-binding protein involved in type VI secretion